MVALLDLPVDRIPPAMEDSRDRAPQGRAISAANSVRAGPALAHRTGLLSATVGMCCGAAVPPFGARAQFLTPNETRA
jgi:hypothetical protein